MECNRDEAERCRDLGHQFLKEGDLGKAHKFFTKSKNLYPLPGIDEFIANTAPSQQAQQDPPKSTATAPAPEPVPSSLSPNYTSEDLEIVTRINSAGCFYEKLKVSSNCGADELKKQYRKLAVLLHPDKNRAPGAQQAFQAINEAFNILSDASQRATYDAKQARQQRPPPIFRENTFYNPRSTDSVPCPACKASCVMQTSYFVQMFKLGNHIAVCYSCKNPFTLIACPQCKAAYHVLVSPQHEGSSVSCPSCKTSFALRFPAYTTTTNHTHPSYSYPNVVSPRLCHCSFRSSKSAPAQKPQAPQSSYGANVHYTNSTPKPPPAAKPPPATKPSPATKSPYYHAYTAPPPTQTNSPYNNPNFPNGNPSATQPSTINNPTTNGYQQPSGKRKSGPSEDISARPPKQHKTEATTNENTNTNANTNTKTASTDAAPSSTVNKTKPNHNTPTASSSPIPNNTSMNNPGPSPSSSTNPNNSTPHTNTTKSNTPNSPTSIPNTHSANPTASVNTNPPTDTTTTNPNDSATNNAPPKPSTKRTTTKKPPPQKNTILSYFTKAKVA